MSAQLVDVALALAARESHHAQRRCGFGHQVISDHALVLAVAGMAGEPAVVWGFLSGETVGAVEHQIAGDPRRHRDHVDVWERFGRSIARWRSRLVALGELPQIVVANRDAVELLDVACARFHNDTRYPDALIAAETLRFLLDRSELAGQQSLVVATELLAEHFAFGTADASGHLAVALGWCRGLGEDPVATLAGLRDRRSGVVSDPGVDRGVLSRRVRDYNKAANDNSAAAGTRAQGVGGPVRQMLVAQRAEILDALAVYVDAFPEVCDAAHDMAHDDIVEFHRFIERRERGAKLARTDSPARAIIELVRHSERDEAWTGRLIWEDPLEFLRAQETGDAAIGIVEAVDGLEVTVRIDQPRLRLRAGDALRLGGFGDARVEGVSHDETGFHLQLRRLKRRDDIAPGVGASMIVAGVVRTLDEVRTRVVQVADRVSARTWLHDARQSAPGTRGRAVPAQLMAELDGHRHGE